MPKRLEFCTSAWNEYSLLAPINSINFRMNKTQFQLETLACSFTNHWFQKLGTLDTTVNLGRHAGNHVSLEKLVLYQLHNFCNLHNVISQVDLQYLQRFDQIFVEMIGDYLTYTVESERVWILPQGSGEGQARTDSSQCAPSRAMLQANQLHPQERPPGHQDVTIPTKL